MANDMDARERFRELVKDIRFAMMTTIHSDGTLHSRPMATQDSDDGSVLWFFTRHSSEKVADIQEDSHVNLAYARPEDNIFVSVNGRATLTRDRAKLEQLWKPFLKTWFPQGLDDPEVCLISVNVEGVEYWDSGNGAMKHLVGFVRSVVTGRPVKADERAS